MRPASGALLGLLAGCSGDSRLSIDARPGDWVVLATIGPDGDVRAAELSTASASPERRTIASDEQLLAFVIEPDTEVVGVDGRRTDDAFVVTGDQAQPGCGRCVLGRDRPPLYGLDGNVCPLPAWARVTEGVADGLVERARGALSIAFPGTCPCEEPPSLAPLSLEPRLITPIDEYPYHVAARLTDGTTALFGRTHARVTRAAGEAALVPLELDGQPIGAAAFGRTFALLSKDGEAYRARLELFDPSFGPPLETVTDLGNIGRVLELPGEMIALLGKGEGDRPALVVSLCAGRPMTCRNVAPPDRRSEFARDVLVTDSGALVATTNALGVLIYDRAPDPRHVQSVDEGSVKLDDGASIPIRTFVLPVVSHVFAGALGDWLFICGKSDERSVSIYSGRISVLTSGSATSADLGLLVEVPTIHECSGFLAPSDGRIALSLVEEVLFFDDSGRLESRGPPATLFPEVGDSLQAESRTIATGARGQIFHGSSAGLQLAYGAGSWRADAYALKHQRALWIVGPDSRARLDGATLVELPGGVGSRVHHATSDGRRIVALTSEGLVALDPESGATELLAPPLAPPSPPRIPGISGRVAPLGVDDWLVAAGAGAFSLVRVHDGEESPVSFSLDNPTTATTESDFFVRALIGSSGTPGAAYFGASSPTEGLSLVVRATAGTKGVLVDRPVRPGASIGALTAWCPDRALATFETSAATDVVRIEHGPLGASFESVGVTPIAGTIVGIAPLGSTIQVLAKSPDVSLNSLPAGPPVELDGIPRSFAVEGEQMIVLGVDGSVYLIEPR